MNCVTRKITFKFRKYIFSKKKKKSLDYIYIYEGKIKKKKKIIHSLNFLMSFIIFFQIKKELQKIQRNIQNVDNKVIRIKKKKR